MADEHRTHFSVTSTWLSKIHDWEGFIQTKKYADMKKVFFTSNKFMDSGDLLSSTDEKNDLATPDRDSDEPGIMHEGQ